MALTRKKGGGRKPVSVVNAVKPQHTSTVWLEDLLVGVIRAMRAEETTNKMNVISMYKLLQLYNDLDVFTTAAIEEELVCSNRTARRYMEVIKYATIHIDRANRQHGKNVDTMNIHTLVPMKSGAMFEWATKSASHDTANMRTLELHKIVKTGDCMSP